MPGKHVQAAEELEIYAVYLEVGPIWSELERRCGRQAETIKRLALSHDWEGRRKRYRVKAMDKAGIDYVEDRRKRLLALREIVTEAETDILNNGLGLRAEDRLSGYLSALKQYFGALNPGQASGTTTIVGENVQVNQIGDIPDYAAMTPEERAKEKARLLEQKRLALEQREAELKRIEDMEGDQA